MIERESWLLGVKGGDMCSMREKVRSNPGQ